MTANDPAKKSYTVVTFIQADTGRIFTNWTGQVPNATYVPMELELAPNSGSLDEKPSMITFPRGVDAWLDGLVSGQKVAPTNVLISEWQVGIGPGASQNEEIPRGRYRLARGVRNPDRRSGIARLELLSLKGRLNVPLGIPATPRCAWTLGDKTCKASVTEETGEVQAIAGKKLTLSGSASTVVTGKPDNRYWHRGVITFEGLSIGIREWDEDGADPYSFELLAEPPASWAGEVVTLRPGCDKLPGTCDSRFGNLENFGGVGIKIPSYQPVLETPVHLVMALVVLWLVGRLVAEWWP